MALKSSDVGGKTRKKKKSKKGEKEAKIPQMDGLTKSDDSSDEGDGLDDADDDEDEDEDDESDELDPDGEEYDEGVEQVSGFEVGKSRMKSFSQEPLGSGDDISDEDASDLFETDNVIVCQYDKITRTRNRRVSCSCSCFKTPGSFFL